MGSKSPSGVNWMQNHYSELSFSFPAANQSLIVRRANSYQQVVPGLRKNNISNYDFAEVVEEEKQEDEICLNIRNRQARFKMIQDKNEFNKTVKRNRSTDFIIEKDVDHKANRVSYHHFGDVSEDDEE